MTDLGTSAPAGKEAVVVQPIINSPYLHPAHHWKLDEHTQRAVNKKMPGRRPSGQYLPVPKHQPDGTMLALDTATQVQPHTMINEIRQHVDSWRKSGWAGAHPATRELLDYWRGTQVYPRPFFCQVEAMETLVWLREAGKRFAEQDWRRITGMLAQTNRERNEGIDRIAIKMATGTGKTRLMQMLIAWMAVTRENGVNVLAITPGLTVKERLEELKPHASKAFQALLPRNLRERISQARVTVLNFQSFRRRDKLTVAGGTDQLAGIGKKLLRRGSREEPPGWRETDSEMLRRLLGPGRRGRWVVLNDEAHHCYLPTPTPKEKGADSEDKEYEEAAALWFNALRSLRSARWLESVYDFSATPMYLRPPKGAESELFPWTVTDYPLIEAVEAGLTKIPRVPVRDDSDQREPAYRNVYANTNPKKIDPNNVPTSVTALLEQMHEHYEGEDARSDRTPVMIVVANTIENATAFYSHIAGHHDGKKWVRGQYTLFSNVEPDGSRPKVNPPTLLVHSGLDNLDDLPDSLAKTLMRAAEIHTLGIDNRKERLARIREIFNTVGLPGKPGEHIRCIVSVSMLTEGWDAKTVTHIFGFRKFGTQLLCEQVAGRGLRRTSFECVGEDGLPVPEMVNIFGVPFNFMRADPNNTAGKETQPYWVCSVPEREDAYRIAFPNIVSYRVTAPQQVITLRDDKVDPYEVKPKSVPSMTEVTGLVGESRITELVEKRRRYVLYKLAALVLTLLQADDLRRRELFRSAMTAVEGWLAHSAVKCSDLRLLLVAPHISAVPQAIAKCCALETTEAPAIVPVFADQVDRTQPRSLHTGGICFETSKRLYHDTRKSELNRAPCDSKPEVRIAEALDELDGIAAWARNFRLGWNIPYFDPDTGAWKNYVPDFVARVRRPATADKPLHLVIEYKGQIGEDSDKKTKTVRDWWLPAVNSSGDPSCHGEWRYVFISAEDDIRAQLLEEIAR